MDAGWPIPPGVHWSDEMPILVPEVQNALPAPSKAVAKEKPIPRLMPPTRRGARFGPPSASPAPAPVVEAVKPQ
jgi:hypothetical protein